MQLRLDKKVAVLTGANGGIGQATRRALENSGAVVYGWDVMQADATAHYYQCVDIRQADNVKAAAERIIKKEGKIDILINNAGIIRDASLIKMTFTDWQDVIDVNLTGAFNCTKIISEYMIRQQAGCIINTASVVAHYGNYGQSNYVASKSGLIGMTKVWAKELGKYNIRVNAVAPGFIATDMIKTVPEKVIHKLLEKSCLKKLGEPEDIANTSVFLCSDAAKFITSHVLQVDGGLVL